MGLPVRNGDGEPAGTTMATPAECTEMGIASCCPQELPAVAGMGIVSCWTKEL